MLYTNVNIDYRKIGKLDKCVDDYSRLVRNTQSPTRIDISGMSIVTEKLIVQTKEKAWNVNDFIDYYEIGLRDKKSPRRMKGRKCSAETFDLWTMWLCHAALVVMWKVI